MGKQEPEVPGEPPASESPSCCCSRTACSWPVPVILGIYVLAFAFWSIRFRGGSNDPQTPSQTPWRPHVEASFTLHRSVPDIQESLPQLQLDLQSEIGIPDTQIEIIWIAPLRNKTWTEVRFIVSSDEPNEVIAPVDLSLLKETFAQLFTQRSANLSLTSTVFGKVSRFEVLQFPGGITVIPPQPGFPLSKVLVLFNFTLHNSLTHIHRNFAKFRRQLANGIILKPNETLFVQLTNLEGSTVRSPLVVQTSILPVVGVMLPSTRLKQLAWEIMSLPRSNLGLNHTLFGRVKNIELSSFLEYTLESAQTPSPSPAPAPAPAPALAPSTSSGSRGRSRDSKGHWQRSQSLAPANAPYSQKGRPTSRSIAPAPLHQQFQHSKGGLAPSYTPSLRFPPSPLLSPVKEPWFCYNEPPSPSTSAIVPSGPMKSQPGEGPPSANVPSARPPFSAPLSLKAPSEAPTGLAPSLAPSPSQLHTGSVFVPAVSSHLTSSGINVGVPMWIIVISMTLLVGIW